MATSSPSILRIPAARECVLLSVSRDGGASLVSGEAGGAAAGFSGAHPDEVDRAGQIEVAAIRLDELRGVLERISAKNVVGPVDRVELEGVVAQVTELSKILATSNLFTLFSLCVEHYSVIARDLCVIVIGEMISRDDDLASFFVKHTAGLKDPLYLLSEKGVEWLLRIIKRENPSFSERLEFALLEELVAKIEAFQREVGSAQRGFVVKRVESEHVIPVFVSRIGEGRIKILVSDSSGYSRGNEFYRELMDKLADKEGVELFIFNDKRQRDGFSCPAFTFLDLINIFSGYESGFDIFEFISEHGDLIAISREPMGDETFTNVFRFRFFPPDMMKVTQSLRQVKQYQIDSPTHFKRITPPGEKVADSPVFSFEAHRVLALAVEECSFFCDEDTALNKYVEQQYFLFVRKILRERFS